MTTLETWIKTDEFAKMARIANITARIWRCEGKGPKFTKLGPGRNAPVVYRLADVLAWMEENSFQSTTGYSPAVLASAPKSSAAIAGPWQKPNG